MLCLCLLPPAFPGGLPLNTCMVDPSKAQHMGQMHYFSLMGLCLNKLGACPIASIHSAAEKGSSWKPGAYAPFKKPPIPLLRFPPG